MYSLKKRLTTISNNRINTLSYMNTFYILLCSSILTILNLFLFPKMTIHLFGGMEGAAYFHDFIFHVELASKTTPYTTSLSWGCYPPLNYVFFKVIAILSNVPINQIPKQEFTPDNFSGGFDYTLFQNALVIFFATITISVMFLLFYKIFNDFFLNTKKNDKFIFVFFILFFFSTPFISALLSGNLVLFILFLLLLSVKWKDSDNKLERELALICIAIATGLKIYPVFFGLLYLKKDRLKEAFRLIIYGIISVFLPFLIFDNPINCLKQWISNLVNIQGSVMLEGIKISSWGSLSKFVFTNLNFSPQTVSTCAFAFSMLCLIVSILVFFKTKNMYNKYFILTTILIFFPSNNWKYTLVFFMLPFLYAIKNSINLHPFEWICYGLIFFNPFFLNWNNNFCNEIYYCFNDGIVGLWVYGISYILILFFYIFRMQNSLNNGCIHHF